MVQVGGTHDRLDAVNLAVDAHPGHLSHDS